LYSERSNNATAGCSPAYVDQLFQDMADEY
jgi:pyrroline-5-carboxylate reductase